MDGAKEGADGKRARDGKSKAPPCVCTERRHKDGAPSEVRMAERVVRPVYPVISLLLESEQI